MLVIATTFAPLRYHIDQGHLRRTGGASVHRLKRRPVAHQVSVTGALVQGDDFFEEGDHRGIVLLPGVAQRQIIQRNARVHQVLPVVACLTEGRNSSLTSVKLSSIVIEQIGQVPDTHQRIGAFGIRALR
ncbi:MAG: hypothetical protein ACUVS4_16555 [Chloroflexaceae bacterium]